MGILEDQAADIRVFTRDAAVEATNMNAAMILTDETPLATITNRTKSYSAIADILTEWGETSKVYKAAFPHFQQEAYSGTLKVGRRIPKGVVQDDQAYAVVSNVCTVTDIGHGLSIGEKVTISDSSGSPLLNGVKIIVDTPSADTFTFAAAGVDDESGTLDYHTGDSSLTVALNDLYDFDPSFHQVLHIFKDDASILEIAAWVEGKPLMHGISVENIDVYDSNDSTDLLSQLAALNYNKTYLIWYHQSGVDAADVSVSVTDEIATVTETNHGLRVGDPLTLEGATPAGLNGNKTVLTVPSLDTFTFDATGIGDGAATGTINYFARYTFFESAIQALQLAKPIGSSSWGHKKVVGFASTPNEILSPSQALVIGDNAGTAKGGGWYKDIKGDSEFLWGRMVSGRTIKVQSVNNWLQVRLQEAAIQAFKSNEQFLYTNADLAAIANALQGPLGTQLTRGGITPYDANNNWLIEYANAFDVPVADKNQNIMRYTVTVRSGTEILHIAVNVAVVT
jgi:hypothetical protein